MLKALRDNLGLLGLVVVLTGVSNTEAYHGAFGLRYQFLALPANHILYRGLTSVFESVPVAAAYLVAIVLIAGQSRLALALGSVDRMRWLNYAIVVVLASVAWSAGQGVGLRLAATDGTMSGSSLPLIQNLSVKSGSAVTGIEGAMQGHRLLLQTAGGVYILRPVQNLETETPLVQFISGGAIDGFKLCTRC